MGALQTKDGMIIGCVEDVVIPKEQAVSEKAAAPKEEAPKPKTKRTVKK